MLYLKLAFKVKLSEFNAVNFNCKSSVLYCVVAVLLEDQRNKTSCKRNIKATLLLIELVFWASNFSSLLPALNST